MRYANREQFESSAMAEIEQCGLGRPGVFSESNGSRCADRRDHFEDGWPSAALLE